MAIENEDLMMELQRVAVLMRRSRRAKVKTRPEAEEESDQHACECRGHNHGGRGAAFGDASTLHGYGNHKCHGGSGRHGQNRILAVLTIQDCTSQKDLAYLLGIRPQSLTQALDSLEQDGFIERKQDEGDHRSRLVCLTPKGHGRAKKVAEDRALYAEDAFGMLTDEEKGHLASILGKIAASLDEEVPVRG
jgi:DNA-binding MarR family transcriptional regulator